MPRSKEVFMIRSAALSALLASLTALADEGGTISGKVEATPSRFLSETVVYLREAKVPPATRHVVPIDQKGMRFVPHVVAIEVGDSVEFLNHDAVEHNVFTPDNEGYNLGMIKPNAAGSYTFQQPGVYTQLCSVHAEMLAYVFVGTSPFQAVVDAHGAFKLEHVPPGTWVVAVWNSHLKAADQTVLVAEGKTVQLSFSARR
jgi:plastocyanin